MWDFLSSFFVLLALTGALILAGDAWWFLQFRQAKKEIGHYAGGPPLAACPVCTGPLKFNETVRTRLGIPSVARRDMSCTRCQSKLQWVGPQRWRWAVDAAANGEMAWLYDGATLTDAELKGVAAGEHTLAAKNKIAARERERQRLEQERIEQERQLARVQALERMRAGDWAVLDEFEPRLAEMPAGVGLALGGQALTAIDLKRNEAVLAVMRPVTLGEWSTRDNRPYVKQVDAGGEFFVTTQRYGYVSARKTVQQKLGVIKQVQVQGNATLMITRSNRKTPEFISGIDTALAQALLTGAKGAG